MDRCMSPDFKSEIVGALRDLISTCIDSQHGYATAALVARSLSLRLMFAARAKERGGFVRDLKFQIARLDGVPPEGGSRLGALHRGWMEAGYAVGSSDTQLLSECIRGEAAALRAYERAHPLVSRLVAAQASAIRGAQSDLAAELARRGVAAPAAQVRS
ncbi:MAG TPA: PA2169 family four-helix-bundle protein [Polyangiaceae bacterium]|jgi:uncharacterized protein (TIGR02284 family)